jgi:hypothetical protein
MRTRATHAEAAATSHGQQTRRPGRRVGAFETTDVGSEITHQQVARRAQEIYLARGDGEGDALSDWLTAERELKTNALMTADTRKRSDPDRFH